MYIFKIIFIVDYVYLLLHKCEMVDVLIHPQKQMQIV